MIRNSGWAVAPNGQPAYFIVETDADLPDCTLGRAAYVIETDKTWQWINGEWVEGGGTGLQGPEGPAGPQGEQGPQGIQGVAGANGAAGAQGPQGDAGLDGADGAQGIQGIQGPAGADGTAGAQGIQGIQGIQGETGAAGADGAQGLQGVQGVQGEAGPAGADGANAPIESWPVGSVFIAVVSTSPATLLGGGTWEAFGTGRVLVGIDAGQAEFDTVEETGGAKTHTLTEAEIPSHVHAQNAPSSASGGALRLATDTNASGLVAAGLDTAATGGSGAHNNLPPYIVVYMWKRTA